MTSRRSLGGGRILGGGQSLSPGLSPTPARHPPLHQNQHHRPDIGLLSPSESSISLSSQASLSPAPPAEPHDIGSRVSLHHADNAAAATASSKLVCPICNEEMMTLLQLNRHLDDAHQNLEEVEQDEVKTWFKTQMVKAKKFQPLAVLNQKLKGLDVFESNDTPLPPSVQAAGPSTTEAMYRQDPDEFVTRAHWQRPGYQDVCSDPTCGKRLGSVNGNVNCRKCGKLFCEAHTMYQMKLSRSAQHEPVRGFWCRVCETCYKSREGYNDHNGLVRNHTDEFMAIRRKTVDKTYLEVSRLEKRLTKLTQLLANPPTEQANGAASLLWPLARGHTQQRLMEQSITDWEDDATVVRCPFCQQEFSAYTFRRHHCRLCGRVVCGDPRTGCSSQVGLNVAANQRKVTEKGAEQISIDVRMCKECKHILFSRSDFERELAERPQIQRNYENLVQFERGIRLLLPRFQKLLVALQDPDQPPSHQQLQDATKVRKRLMDAFAQYDTAARRIRDLPTDSPYQKRLQKAVYQQAYNFLSLHMLPLKSLPRILKHASPHGAGGANRPPMPAPGGSSSSSGPAHLAAIRRHPDLDASSVGTTSSAAVSAMEAEEKELKERLIVLEEQRFLVGEMMASASRQRRFDELAALAGNAEDLDREIDRVQGQLGQLDFAAAYQGGLVSPPG